MAKKKSKDFIPHVEVIKIEDLKPYPKNARIHTDEQVKIIADSIREFGFVIPVVIDNEHNIIAGHGRILASTSLGLTEIPCVKIEHLKEDQVKALRLVDNRLTEMSEWDYNLLMEEIGELNLSDLKMEDLGFDKNFIGEFKPDFMGDDFNLPDGDKEPFQQMTFVLHDEQVAFIKKALEEVKEKKSNIKNFGNKNVNGNALYRIVKEWVKNG